MKTLMTMIVFVLTLGSQAIAAPFSALKLRTSSNIPIRVVLNGQTVSQGSSLVMLKGLRAGYHDLFVYYKIQDFYGEREEPLFLDKVFLQPNTVTHAIINENQQFIVENIFNQQVANRPHASHYTYNPNHQPLNGQYGTKPIFWSTTNEPSQCGTLTPNYLQQQELAPMNHHQFHQLKRSIENQWFSDTKIDVFEQALVHNYFTAQQVSELVSLFSFSNDRLQVAKKAYLNTLDQNNYFVVFDHLKFNSSIENLSNYIASL